MYHLRPSIAVVIFLVVTALPVQAQKSNLEVSVFPDTSFPFSPVSVRGFARQDAASLPQVRLEFRNPRTGSIDKDTTVTARSNGDYEMTFGGAGQTGVWRVTATRVGSGRKAVANFEVKMGALLSPIAEQAVAAFDAYVVVLQELHDAIEEYVDFSGKDAILNEISEAIQHAVDLQPGLADAQQAAKQLESGLVAHAAAVSPDPIQHLGPAAARSRQAASDIEYTLTDVYDLLQQSQQAAEWCFMWESYAQILDWLSWTLNLFAGNVLDVAAALGKTYVKSKFPYPVVRAANAVEESFTRKKSGPFPVTGGALYLAGEAASIGQFMFEVMVKENCSWYKGSVSGTYHAELRHNGIAFFNMDYTFNADASLVFEQRTPGQEVYLKGRVRCCWDKSATPGWIAPKYGCDLDMAPFSLTGGDPIEWCRMDKRSPLLRPGFMLYLKGVANDAGVDIELDRIGYDFETVAKAYYVVLALNSVLPSIGDFEFPLMDGEWFFTRVTHLSNPNVAMVTLPYERTQTDVKVKKDFFRDMHFPATPQRKEVYIKMEMQIDLKLEQ